MSDKLRQGVNVVPVFVDGENVQAGKLNALGLQIRESTRALERAVGDIHDESYPYSADTAERLSSAWGRHYSGSSAPDPLTNAATRALDIVSLGRLIGPASALNPRSLPSDGEQVTESVPAGVYEFTLQYPVRYEVVSYPLAFSGTGSVFTTKVATLGLLNASGEYYLDETRGTIWVGTQTTGGTISYYVATSREGSIFSYGDATFNVIPDPNQITAGGNGCTVDGTPDSNGRHDIDLPLCTHQQSDITLGSTALTTLDLNYSKQLLLPEVLVSNYSAGEVIPSGFVLLKNWTTGEVYDGATYYYVDSSSLKIGGVDLADAVADGDDFILLTVGTNITTAIDDLRVKGMLHNHDRSFGEAPIDIDDVVGFTAAAGESGRFVRSTNSSNFAPQYLHRDGWRTGEDTGYNDENILRGHLVLGDSSKTDAGTYLALDSDSFAIYFGSGSVASIYGDSSSDLHIDLGGGSGNIYLNDPYNAVLKTAGDLTVWSTAGDLLLIANDTGEGVTVSSNIDINLNSTLGLTKVANGAAAESLIAGHQNIGAGITDHWEIDTGRGSAGDWDTNSAWVFPRLYMVHRAGTVSFQGYKEDNTAASSDSEVVYWETTIALPDLNDSYDTGDNILSVAVMAKKNGTNTWYGSGDSGGKLARLVTDASAASDFYWLTQEQVSYYLNNSSAAVPNIIGIRIPAMGPASVSGSENGNTFVAAGTGAATMSIDFKIMFMYAAAGSYL